MACMLVRNQRLLWKTDLDEIIEDEQRDQDSGEYWCLDQNYDQGHQDQNKGRQEVPEDKR